jgi:hypothetical protein
LTPSPKVLLQVAKLYGLLAQNKRLPSRAALARATNDKEQRAQNCRSSHASSICGQFRAFRKLAAIASAAMFG